MEFSSGQLAIIESSLNSQIFLSGPAGSGKTSTAIARLQNLMQHGLPGHEILLLFPQRNLSTPYQDILDSMTTPGSSKPVIATYGGLARRGLNLFWPLIKKEFSSFSADHPPVFLTLESSLYFLSRIVEPLIIEKGYFSSITIQRNRLYSQILDNLNKAAVHGFPHEEISDRLLGSWIGDANQGIVYENAQDAANLFRDYCYAQNLLDFSLQVEIFTKSLQRIPQVLEYYKNQYKHLVYDNSEEDIPVSHDFVKSMMPNIESSLIVFDHDAGYRSFLGASPTSAKQLADLCEIQETFSESFTTSEQLSSFNQRFRNSLYQDHSTELLNLPEQDNSFSILYQASYPPLIKEIANQISAKIEAGTSPKEIVVLAPFLSDALRFMFSEELAKKGVLCSTHRPSRPLRDEPVTHCLLTLAAFAHPQWKILPSSYDLAMALLQVISGLDLMRANLLSKQAIRKQSTSKLLPDFELMDSTAQDRITFYFGSRYQELADWIFEYSNNPPLPLDYFFIHLFGEILSQPGFGFHDDPTRSIITNQIIQSVQKFRLSVGQIESLNHSELGIAYHHMVKTGVLANQYLKSWTDNEEESVYLSPAYTFLLKNKPVDYQYWLDVGSSAWYERIYQPLTNPHILHRDWQTGTPWRDLEEQRQNIDNLNCLSTGLIRRCRKGITFCLTETDEHGFDQKGLMIQAINNSINRWGNPE